jgi:hypothetical protein
LSINKALDIDWADINNNFQNTHDLILKKKDNNS